MKSCSVVVALFALVGTVLATPYNTATLDGRPTEYDSTDLRGTFTGGGGAFGAGVGITNLYVTWDANFLYIALQGFELDNKLVVMVDVDPTNNTGATSTTNWVNVTPDYIRYNDVGWNKSPAGGAVPFGLDYMIASEGFFNNINRVLYDGEQVPTSTNVISLFDAGNGATPTGAGVDMVVQSDTTSNELKGIEAKLSWSALYGANTNRFGIIEAGEIVPRGATIRVFANIHNNDPAISFSANDAIPRQVSGNAAYAAGLLTTDDYIDIPIDPNGDGIPNGTTDVNAPFIRAVQGAQGQRFVLALFNEALNEATATTPSNWEINGGTPAVITMTQTNGVLIELTNDVPAAGSLIKVASTNVADNFGNARYTYNYLAPAASGLSTQLTVRFLLETASGLGLAPGATNFYINGGGLPLEFGYPPATSSPLSEFSGSVHFRDVVFPPGTPVNLNYKYSGVLTGTGTNNYEAVRLVNFDTAARLLTLNTNGVTMVVTDHLGAVAAPFRTPGSNTAYAAVYADGLRGDAGVRERITMIFQLDLRNYSTQGISRVLVQGSDPLRGFNTDGTLPAGVSDFAGGGAVGWTAGGITLFDNGTSGDTNANDKIFAREWSFTVDGTDAVTEPGFPNSLVGGDLAQPPYNGFGWANGRSPRSFFYKFYVYTTGGNDYDSQSGNIEYYIQGSPTNIVQPLYVWDNNALPPPPATNAPFMIAIAPTGANTRLQFVNLPSEVSHGVQLSTNLLNDWLDYGQRAAGSGGSWTAIVQGVGKTMEHFRAFAGVGNPQRRAWWTPNPIPSTGATLSVYFDQNYRTNAGQRDVRWFGRILGSGFTNLIPMTFTNQGGWVTQIPVGPVVPAFTNTVQFLFVNPQLTLFDKTFANKDFFINVGGRAAWTPEMPTQGGPFTVTYTSTGGVLATATQVLFHHGFDNFQGVTTPNMTNLLGTNLPGIWEITVTVPPARSNAVDWVFQNGAGTFDNNSTFDWRAFIYQQ